MPVDFKLCFFFSSRRRHTRWNCDWSSDVCSSDLRLKKCSRKWKLDTASSCEREDKNGNCRQWSAAVSSSSFRKNCADRSAIARTGHPGGPRSCFRNCLSFHDTTLTEFAYEFRRTALPFAGVKVTSSPRLDWS